MSLRLFCALPVPEEVRAELVKTGQTLRGTFPNSSISWTKPANFHLTLVFLGEVEQRRLDDLQNRLDLSCRGIAPLELVCGGIGCFPTLQRPRVIWAGVQDKAKDGALAQLQKQVAQACSPFMERREKGSFSGHVTLGRIRSIENADRARLAQQVEANRETVFGRWVAPEVELISSDLSQGVPRYTVLSRIPLIG